MAPHTLKQQILIDCIHGDKFFLSERKGRAHQPYLKKHNIRAIWPKKFY